MATCFSASRSVATSWSAESFRRGFRKLRNNRFFDRSKPTPGAGGSVTVNGRDSARDSAGGWPSFRDSFWPASVRVTLGAALECRSILSPDHRSHLSFGFPDRSYVSLRSGVSTHV